MAKKSRTPRDLPKDSALLKRMRQRYKLADESDAEQAKREEADISFEDGQQWTSELLAQRAAQSGGASGMPDVPARPSLVIDKVKEPVRQILNQERLADIGIEITPADDFGDLGITPDDTEILLREGLVRRIQRDSHAADARTWAYKRAVIAGRGFYIVRTKFLPGATWDQEIYIDRIYNQAGVKLDPSHEKPDGSDAEWEFIGTWMPWDRFKSEYPKDADGKHNPFSDASDADFMGLTEDYPDWFRDEDGERAVRIVDYWYVDRTHRDVAMLEDGSVVDAKDVPKGETPMDTRTVTEKVVKFCKIAGGCYELERTDESGPDMPIIKVIGDEVIPYDEQRRYNGMVRAARGPQMAFNYMVSKMVEVIGLSPIPPLEVDPEAIDGYEPWYKVANTRALPFLPSRTYDDDGRQLKPVTRLNADPNIGPIAAAAGMFDEMIKSTTAVPDSTLGNVDPSLKSGKAIQAVVQNAAMSTSNYLDNLKRSMIYEAQVINNKLYAIYTARPGRLVRILTGEGEQQTISIGEPPNPQGQELQAKAAKVAKLTKDAHFNIIAKISRSSENRRQQFVEMFGQLIAADPSLMTVAGDLFFKNMDIPESRQLQKRMKVMLAPPVQKEMAAEESGQQAPSPELQQAQQMIEQLQAQLQEAMSGVQETQMKIQADQQSEAQRLQFEQWKVQTESDLKWKIEELHAQIKQAELAQKQAQAVMDNQAKERDAFLRDQGSLRDTLASADDANQSRAHERELDERVAQREQMGAEQDRNFQREESERQAMQQGAPE